MTVLYSGWGQSPVIQTTDWSKDLFYNPQAPAKGKEFAWLSNARLQIDAVYSQGDASNCKVMVAGPQPNNADRYIRWTVQMPAIAQLPPVRGAFFQWAEYPWGLPFGVDGRQSPPVGLGINGDDGTNRWGLYLDESHPDRWAWIGPPIDAKIHDIGLHVRSSPDPTIGAVELWLEGTKQTFRLNAKQTLNLATITPANAIGPQHLILDAYCSAGFLPPGLSFPVIHGPPVIGSMQQDIFAPQHVYRVATASQPDRTFSDPVAAGSYVAQVLGGSGHAVAAFRDS